MGEWEEVPLSAVADLVITGCDPSQLGNQLVEYFSIPAYDSGSAQIVATSSIHSNKFVVPDEAVLVSRLNPHIPRIWLIKDRPRYLRLCSTEFVPLAPKPSTTVDFLYQLCRSTRFLFSMRELVTGTTGSHQRVDRSALLQINVDLPPPSEQRAIAEVLGALDDKIEANRKVAEISDNLWMTLLNSELDEIEDMDVLPHGWERRSLTSLAKFINGKAFTRNATGTGRMVVRIAELNSGPGASTVYNNIIVDEDFLARPGDLLFAWSGSLTVKRWYRNEAIINQHIFKVIPHSDVPVWLVHAHLLRLLPKYQVIAAGKATTMGHIQRRDLDVEVAVPRESALALMNPSLTGLWSRALAAERESLTLAALRDTLLPKLMSGELRVRDAEHLVEDVA